MYDDNICATLSHIIALLLILFAHYIVHLFIIYSYVQTGGEKVGDVLRYTSQWTLGLPRGDGVITTAMSFSGGISWQVSMFDVARASRWEDVVAALVSNEPSRTDEVLLLFERPLSSDE